MTDKELLEAAAKASGAMVEFTGDESVAFLEDGVAYPAWNPLVDDGDALRLAVQLRLDIFMAAPGSPDATVEVIAIHGKDEAPFAIETLDGGDPYAATRRAIVKAAAAMAPSEQK
jgi:hypothetical protein